MEMSDAARAWYEQDYPFIDAQGTTWLDPQGFKSASGPGLCFMCGRLTKRIDINYGAYNCNEEDCNALIRAHLEAMTGRDYSDEYLDFNLPSNRDDEKAGD